MQTLLVIVVFIAITARLDSDIDFLPDFIIYILVLVFATSFIALPVTLLMHIWGVK
jgi:hypothetical protein